MTREELQREREEEWRRDELEAMHHERKLAEDYEYALEYVSDKYGLDEAYEQFYQAALELEKIGYNMDALGLFKEF